MKKSIFPANFVPPPQIYIFTQRPTYHSIIFGGWYACLILTTLSPKHQHSRLSWIY